MDLRKSTKKERRIFELLQERICPIECYNPNGDCQDEICLGLMEDMMRHITRHGKGMRDWR